jgi:hypothetical protein
MQSHASIISLHAQVSLLWPSSAVPCSDGLCCLLAHPRFPLHCDGRLVLEARTITKRMFRTVGTILTCSRCGLGVCLRECDMAHPQVFIAYPYYTLATQQFVGW